MDGERPLGGNLNDAVRVGDTVRRRAGPWTPTVHALLRFLERESFPAPRALGMDDQGREVLTYIEGEAHSGHPAPLPDAVFDERHLIGAARLLRRYHDVVVRFLPPAGARWRLVSPEPHEVTCHNDWSPWNALFRDGSFALTLDWDLAGPGSRLWDVANAAYCWAPMISDATAIPDVTERVRRLRLFCDEYGLRDRAGLVDTMRERLLYMLRFVETEARLGDPGMRRLVESRAAETRVRSDVAYLDDHRAIVERALA